MSGLMVPEKTRTRLTLPTYGSEVVFTTSASRGPPGSHASLGFGTPSGLNTSGSWCSGGAGKALVAISSSSDVPRPVLLHTGMTGKNDPRATARSRSSTSTAWSIASPPRYRSISDSSSDSSITPSISVARCSSRSSAYAGSGPESVRLPVEWSYWICDSRPISPVIAPPPSRTGR